MKFFLHLYENSLKLCMLAYYLMKKCRGNMFLGKKTTFIFEREYTDNVNTDFNKLNFLKSSF